MYLIYRSSTILLYGGQVDSIGTALVFAALFGAHRKKYVFSGIMFTLALNMKLQMGIFLPLWILILIHSFYTSERFLIQITFLILAIVATQFALVLPFALSEPGITPLLSAVKKSFDQMPGLSHSAFNLWYWFFDRPGYITDSGHSIFGVTHKQLGLAMFCIASLFGLLPILRIVLRNFFTKQTFVELDKITIWLTGAIISLNFFFFNTQMHERYSHPTFVFLIVYAFYSNNFKPYILFSIAYFLNLEQVLQWLKLANYGTLLFEPKMIAGLFFVLIIYLFMLLYRHEPRGHKEGLLVV